MPVGRHSEMSSCHLVLYVAPVTPPKLREWAVLPAPTQILLNPWGKKKTTHTHTAQFQLVLLAQLLGIIKLPQLYHVASVPSPTLLA